MLYQLGKHAVRAEGEYWVADSARVIVKVLLKEGASVCYVRTLDEEQAGGTRMGAHHYVDNAKRFATTPQAPDEAHS